MKLFAVATVLLLTFAAACGGDDDGGSADPASSGRQTQASPTETGSQATPASDGTSGSSSQGGFVSGIPVNLALVTIDGEMFEFDMSAACLSLFGIVGGSGKSTDGSDITLDIEIQPEDIGPSSVRVQDDRTDKRVDWEANVELMNVLNGVSAGQSQVDSFSIGDGAAGGTATFIDSFAILLGENPEPVKGSFSINCGS